MLSYILFLYCIYLTPTQCSLNGTHQENVGGKDGIMAKIENCAALIEGYDKRIEKYEEVLGKYAAKVEELEEKVEDQRTALEENTRERRLVLDNDTSAAFYVQLTNDLSGIGNYQVIVFDLVTTNVGSGYNSADGIFTVPATGVYVFTWTASNSDATQMQTELVVNGITEGRTWSDSGSHDDVSSATGTVVMRVYERNTVWVRSTIGHNNRLKGTQLTTFSGWRLYA